jgi:hypothetical protein
MMFLIDEDVLIKDWLLISGLAQPVTTVSKESEKSKNSQSNTGAGIGVGGVVVWARISVLPTMHANEMTAAIVFARMITL